jgi:DNA-damage-inducible protein J
MIQMNQAILSIRVNADDKKKFEIFCDETGLNISTAINLFIKTVIREQMIPFTITSNEFNKEIYRKLKEADQEMETSSKRYTIEDMLERVKDNI